MSDTTFLIIIVVGGCIAGVLCGLVLLYIGKSRNRPELGRAGFIACCVSGLVLGLLLALPMAAAFTVIIVMKGAPKEPEAATAPKMTTTSATANPRSSSAKTTAI